MATTVVIGAGIAGLGAALRARAAGDDVTVLESRPILGGKLHCVETEGYRFDAGPSFLTQPERLDHLFALFGENRSDHLRIEPVDPSVRYWFADGHRMCTPVDRDALVAQLATLGSTPDQISAYLDELAGQYERVGRPFVGSDIRDPRFWLAPRTVTRMAGSLSLLGRTLHQYNRSWFPDAPQLVQMLGRYATYAGNDPYRCPAFMASIADVELRQGIFYPEDGLRSVPEALVALGRRHGVTYQASMPVTGLRRDGRSVRAATTAGAEVIGDRFISAVDPQHVAGWLDRPLSTAPRALSALIWFWGVDAVDDIDLHNIFFSADYAAEFAALQHGTPHDDPSIYVNCSSTRSPTHAPSGRQNWFVMVNSPADDGQDWTTLQDRMTPLVQGKLSRMLGTDVKIHAEHRYAPPDIARTSGAWKGAIYGPAGNSMTQLFAKQPVADRSLDNLVFCGGSSHPGGGIPMCLASAELAVQRSFG